MANQKPPARQVVIEGEDAQDRRSGMKRCAQSRKADRLKAPIQEPVELNGAQQAHGPQHAHHVDVLSVRGSEDVSAFAETVLVSYGPIDERKQQIEGKPCCEVALRDLPRAHLGHAIGLEAREEGARHVQRPEQRGDEVHGLRERPHAAPQYPVPLEGDGHQRHADHVEADHKAAQALPHEAEGAGRSDDESLKAPAQQGRAARRPLVAALPLLPDVGRHRPGQHARLPGHREPLGPELRDQPEGVVAPRLLVAAAVLPAAVVPPGLPAVAEDLALALVLRKVPVLRRLRRRQRPLQPGARLLLPGSPGGDAILEQQPDDLLLLPQRRAGPLPPPLQERGVLLPQLPDDLALPLVRRGELPEEVFEGGGPSSCLGRASSIGHPTYTHAPASSPSATVGESQEAQRGAFEVAQMA
mmetsp:Transcript_72679/g.213021  ORF Transcript_72679/g.213021 Transcript_72679/m.213021 type:complete len:414 (+) Transcript_72679:1158-2399(+)